MSYKFKIGDQVVAIAPPDDNDDIVGLEGVVQYINKGSSLPINVLFFNNREQFSWSCELETLQLAKDLRESELK